MPPIYNERAWAIDVISEINSYSSNRTRAIVRAGGENTIRNRAGNLFPDVLLFGDNNGWVVRQGWELKMPDTSITDQALLVNAETKAKRLGLNSYVVWNANEAVLYLQDDSGNFVYTKAWTPTGILHRPDVMNSRDKWVELLHHIIDDLNDLFDSGQIRSVPPETAISDTLLLNYVEYYVPRLIVALQTAVQQNAVFAAQLDFWWSANKLEHPQKFPGFARVILVNWINRFLFAHYLKRFHNAAREVDTIRSGCGVNDAIQIFGNISSSCDFINVFNNISGLEYLDDETWEGLIALNTSLYDFRLDTINQESFHRINDLLFGASPEVSYGGVVASNKLS